MSGAAPAEPAPTPDLVKCGPAGTRFAEVRHFGRIDSTNRYLLDVARRRPVEGVVAVADHQTAGRGRLGRRWEAPPGANLLVSVLLLPRLGLEQLHLCNVAVALATAEACRRTASLEPMLKWPNDLVVGTRKLAGILAETAPVAASPSTPGRAVVVGAGINVAWPPADDERDKSPATEPPGDASRRVPDELRLSATSIRREIGKDVGRAELLELLLVDLERRLGQLDEEGGAARLAVEYRRRCATLGQVVQVTTATDELRGEAVDITPDGHLVVDVGACFTTVSAGDVIHLRGGQ